MYFRDGEAVVTLGPMAFEFLRDLRVEVPACTPPPKKKLWDLKLKREARAAEGGFKGIILMMDMVVLAIDDLTTEEGEREREEGGWPKILG